MTRRLLATLGLLAACHADAGAQTIESYELRVYAPGATAPQFTTPFPASAVECNLPPTTSSTTTNPAKVVWTDPAAPTRECHWLFGSVLPSLPGGSYEGALVAVNAGGRSSESNRAPFVRLDAPAAPGGVRFSR